MSAFGANVLVELVDALQSLPAETVISTTDLFVRTAESEAARARMAVVMGRYPLTAKLKSVQAGPGYAEMTFLGVPVGFWVWAEEGTRAHDIRPRVAFRSDKGMYRAALGGGLAEPRQVVRHPGLRGRAAWSHTIDRVDEAMGQAVDDAANNLDLWG